MKIISKAFSEKLKKALPDLIFWQQWHIGERHIGESRRLMSVIEIAKIKNGCFLVTMGMEIALYSFNYNFLISTLEKYAFNKSFIWCIKILLRH